jgi:hypothetical protein
MPKAVSFPRSGDPEEAFSIPLGAEWRILSIAFDVDLGGAASDADVWVQIANPSGGLIAGAMVGSAQTSGSVVTYNLSPWLNPCDGGSNSALAITPDTFADVTVIGACTITLSALDVTTGNPVSGAQILNGWLWIDEGAGGAPDEVPLLTPLAQSEQGIAA